MFGVQGKFKPASVFPFELSRGFKQRIAGLFAANDRTRLRSPNKSGPSTRPYEGGDALKDLSRAHLFRLDELHTRVDSSPGRQRATVVLHLGPNMEFGSGSFSSTANKGQIALAAAGMLQLVHEGASHDVSFLAHFSPSLGDFLSSIEHLLEKSQWLWVVSDVLEVPSQGNTFASNQRTSPSHGHSNVAPQVKIERDGGAANLLPFLATNMRRKCGLILVRDALELPLQTTESTALLTPFQGRQPRIPNSNKEEANLGGNLFSGVTYLQNLTTQLDLLETLARKANTALVLAHNEVPVEELMREVAFPLTIA